MAIHKSEQKRDQILHAAGELFLEFGYQVNMDQIAKKAGVSKQTVYSHFKTKDILFETCMHNRCAEHEVETSAFDMASPAKDELIKFGVKFQNLLLDEAVRSTFQNAVSQSSSNPDIANIYLRLGPERTGTILANYLEAKVKSGEITLTTSRSPYAAAMQLLLLFHGKAGYWGFFGKDSQETDEERKQYIEECVELFVKGNQ